MDCAKAMVYFSGLTIPLVAIPTTSGSGSEVTDFAVLTHGGSKHPLVDGAVRPAVAILDGTLLDTLPSGLVADAGYDVLAHAVEGYVATGAGSISDALASAAFAAALRALPRSYRGDCTVRQEIHVAATMAGMAFTQAGLGLCHALAHVLGGRFHVAHGRLNAILLPAVVEANQCAVPKYAALARSAGMEGTADTVAVRNLKNALIQLRKTLNLPQTLGQVGIPKRQLLQTGLVDAVLADPCCATNPEKVNRGLVQQVLEQVSGNG